VYRAHFTYTSLGRADGSVPKRFGTWTSHGSHLDIMTGFYRP